MSRPSHAAHRPHGIAPVRLTDAVAAVTAWTGLPAGRVMPPFHDATPARGPGEISGVTLDSTAVQDGDLFAALPGSAHHGAAFAADAVRAGARAVLTDPAGVAMIEAQTQPDDTPILVVDEPRQYLGPFASVIYGNPSARLAVIGVTGTAGKTTTCYLIQAALMAVGERTGLIGTVDVRIDGRVLPSALTTPEAPEIQALLAMMVEQGVTTVVMEVSSHALVQGRVDGTSFAAAAFTNLSHDHLDFHGDMEHYFAAKKLLFDGRASAEIVVIDDDYGRRLASERPGALTVSVTSGRPADWTAAATQHDGGAQQITLQGPHQLRIAAEIALPGAFNVANAATALACLHAIGRDPVAAAEGLAEVRVPGRMERIDVGQPFLAFVDYAHKPAALEAVLAVIRRECTGKIIVVFGAGGDRDPGKRPQMGRLAAERADVVIVTDDNPRSEDPAEIRRQIVAGAEISSRRDIVEIGDRAAAIAAAVSRAMPSDAVLVAGKGHEQGQEVGGAVREFSDVAVLKRALTARLTNPEARA